MTLWLDKNDSEGEISLTAELLDRITRMATMCDPCQEFEKKIYSA